jgi:putative peptidoglycan lipid II flippase
MALNVVLSFTLPGLFEKMGWIPVGGLALANTIATSLEMVVLFIMMRKRLEGIQGKHMLKGTIKSTISTVLMSIAIVFWMSIAAQYSVLFSTLIGITLGVGVYGLSLVVMKVPETKFIINMVLSHIRRT